MNQTNKHKNIFPKKFPRKKNFQKKITKKKKSKKISCPDHIYELEKSKYILLFAKIRSKRKKRNDGTSLFKKYFKITNL